MSNNFRCVCLCACAALCLTVPHAAASYIGTPRTLFVTDKDNGGSIALAPGQMLCVVLHANLTTGYEWNLVMPPRSPLWMTTNPTYKIVEAQPGIVGASGKEVYYFYPLSRPDEAQTTYLRFIYLRPFEPGISGAKIWQMKVIIRAGGTMHQHSAHTSAP